MTDRYDALREALAGMKATSSMIKAIYWMAVIMRESETLLSERDSLLAALRSIRVAVTYVSPPKDFGTPDDPNPCYEARVPVAFVEEIDAALTTKEG